MSLPKRISFITSSLGSGGAERVLSIVANSLARAGSEISIFATSTHKTEAFYPLETSIAFSAPFAGRAYRRAVTAATSALRIRGELRDAVLAKRPEVVVSFVDKTNTLALASLGKTGIPVVACEHIYPPAQPLGFFWETARKVYYPRATAITVLTEEAISFFPASLRERIVVLPNPVLPPPALRGVAPRRERRVLSAGRFTAQKGFDRLLRAFAQVAPALPEWRLRILGDGPLRTELESLRDSLGLRERVEMPGVTKDIYGEYARASFYALSSRFEGFPMTLCEALASGLPAVAMDCLTGPRHILRDGVDGLLVPEGDIEALAGAMRRLMQDEALRAGLAAGAPEVAERFSLARIMERWEALFDRATIRGGAR